MEKEILKHIEEKIKICITSLKENLLDRIIAVEKGIEKAESAMNLRLEGMNEFRAQLEKQTHSFMTRTEIELRIEKLDAKIETLMKATNVQQGSNKWADHLLEAIIGAIVLIIVWMWTH